VIIDQAAAQQKEASTVTADIPVLQVFYYFL
jgi:hypothetical protein